MKSAHDDDDGDPLASPQNETSTTGDEHGADQSAGADSGKRGAGAGPPISAEGLAWIAALSAIFSLEEDRFRLLLLAILILLLFSLRRRSATLLVRRALTFLGVALTGVFVAIALPFLTGRDGSTTSPPGEGTEAPVTSPTDQQPLAGAGPGEAESTHPIDSSTAQARRVEELLNEAAAYEQAGLLDEAARSYDAVIAADVADPQGYFGAAWVAYQNDDVDLATQRVVEGLTHDRDFAQLYWLRSLLHQAEGDDEAAITDATRYVDLEESAHSRTRRATLLNSVQGGADSALEDAERAIELDATFGPARYERARALITLGRSTEAQTELRDLIDTSATVEALWCWRLALLEVDDGLYDDAAALLQRAVELDEDEPVYLVELGDVERYRGHFDDAMEHYGDAAGLGADLDDLAVGTAWAFLGRQQYAEALDEVEAALDRDDLHDSNVDELFHIRVRAELALDEAAEARDHAKEALDRFPAFAEMHLLLSKAEQALGNDRLALQAALAAGAASPSWYEPWAQASFLQSELQMHDDAVASARTAATLATTPEALAHAEWRAGWALYRAGQRQDAVASLERASAAMRESPFYLSELAWIGYDEVGEHDRAIDVLTQAVDLARSRQEASSEGTALYRRGWIRWYRLEDAELALADATAAREAAPSDSTVVADTYALEADMAESQGDLVLAAENWNRVAGAGNRDSADRAMSLLLAPRCPERAVERLDGLLTLSPDEYGAVQSVAYAITADEGLRKAQFERALQIVVNLLADAQGPMRRRLVIDRANLLASLSRTEEGLAVLQRVPAPERDTEVERTIAMFALRAGRPVAEVRLLALASGAHLALRELASREGLSEAERGSILLEALSTAERNAADPDSFAPSIAVDRARILGDLQRYDDALVVLSELPSEQHTALTRQEQGYAARRAGHPPTEVEGYLRQSIDLEGPSSRSAYVRALLAETLYQQQRYDEARAMGLDALSVSPDEQYAAQVLASVAAASGVATPLPLPRPDEAAFRTRFCAAPAPVPTTRPSVSPTTHDDGSDRWVVAGLVAVIGAGLVLSLRRGLKRRSQHHELPDEGYAPNPSGGTSRGTV